jgi:hypothetical protein
MKKTYRLFIPVALFFLVFSNYSCKGIKEQISELGVITFTKDLKDSVQVNATNANTYTKENTVKNLVKSYIDSQNIQKERIKSVVLQDAVATISDNSTMDFSDIESATLYVNGVKWGEFPANVSGKTLKLKLATGAENILNVMVNEPTLTFKYESKTNKATPASMIKLALSVKVEYQVL